MGEILSFCGLWQLPQALLVVMEEDFLIFVQHWGHIGQLLFGWEEGRGSIHRAQGWEKDALLVMGNG